MRRFATLVALGVTIGLPASASVGATTRADSPFPFRNGTYRVQRDGIEATFVVDNHKLRHFDVTAPYRCSDGSVGLGSTGGTPYGFLGTVAFRGK